MGFQLFMLGLCIRPSNHIVSVDIWSANSAPMLEPVGTWRPPKHVWKILDTQNRSHKGSAVVLGANYYRTLWHVHLPSRHSYWTLFNTIYQWSSILVLKGHCPACSRCFPVLQQVFNFNYSFIYIGCVDKAGTPLLWRETPAFLLASWWHRGRLQVVIQGIQTQHYVSDSLNLQVLSVSRQHPWYRLSTRQHSSTNCTCICVLPFSGLCFPVDRQEEDNIYL